MQRIAERVGVRAPSPYQRFPDTAAVEAGLQVQGMPRLAEELEAAEAEMGGEQALLVLARASPPVLPDTHTPLHGVLGSLPDGEPQPGHPDDTPR
ncbi:hypothetical protein ACFY0G_44585 [Streptomyces sp. NPDC001552]|uniref:hypothetical protein n=1 Tax=Streptomyces sp. NPDC001552 TaxID=3364587 RepID=UPI0036B3C3FE